MLVVLRVKRVSPIFMGEFFYKDANLLKIVSNVINLRMYLIDRDVAEGMPYFKHTSPFHRSANKYGIPVILQLH